MSPAILMLVTFLAVVTTIAGVYSVLSDLFLRDRSKVSKRIDDEFRKRQREQVKKHLLFKDLGRLVAEVEAEDDDRNLRRKFEAMVEQSGLDLTPRKLLTIACGVALVLGALGFLVASNPAFGIVGFLIGGAVPLLYVRQKRNARRELLLSQLPDAFDLMSRVVRAGQTMSQSLQAVADEFQPPIAVEFSYCYEQQNLGLSPEVALRDLARRTGLLEVKIFVLAMMIQQQTGGNLAELLDKLSNLIRDRFRIRGQIKTLTAEGRMQAMVLLGLPPALFVIMLLMNREFSVVLLEYPALLVGILVSEAMGAFFIRRIVNFDF